MQLSKIDVCDICGEMHGNMHILFRGTVCDRCYRLLNNRDALYACVSERVQKTYNRLKTFEELTLDAAEIGQYLSKVEALLKEEDSPFETVRAQIIGNFEVISTLETTLIFANIDEVTNKMQQATIAFTAENEKLKKQLEDIKGKKVEYENHINRLNKELEELKEQIKGLENKEETEELAKRDNSIGMKFTLIPAGEFFMGSEESGDEKPVRKVKITSAFYLGTYPVTQREWKAVMGGDNPSEFKSDDLPVETVSWNDVQEFIKKLNEKEGTDKYRLPSEAEWEYACRAGTTTRYSFGDDGSKLGDYAWYSDNSGGETHPVGQKKPNPYGLHDMHGNVWEWVQDTWHESYDGAPTDGSAWESGDSAHRVIRGGSWRYRARYCRSAYRDHDDPLNRDFDLGFRLLQEL
jgi:formylglycine-generating enzyme required for sulfatase activity